MTLDTVVWIASMTKAITATAAMQLVERGKLGLEEAGERRWSPSWRRAQVLEGFDRAGKPRLRAPRRPITLRHLLTHTAGYSATRSGAPDIAQYQTATGTPGITTCTNAALTTPLLFDPGDRWEYGISIDWAGKMVEAASGQQARPLVPGQHLRPARDDGHVVQALAGAAGAAGAHAPARRRWRADRHRVRAAAGAGVLHGRRRTLRHRARLPRVRADDHAGRLAGPAAQVLRPRDRGPDGAEPHRPARGRPDEDRHARRCPTTWSCSRACRRSGA